MTDTVVRYDPDAERATIGMALAGFDVDAMAAIVKPNDFYQPRHEAIWQAILVIREKGEPVEPIPVYKQLVRQGTKDPDAAYLSSLYGEAPIAGDPLWYAQRVADEAQFRALGTAATAIRQAASNQGATIDEAREQSRSALDDALRGAGERKHVRVADILDDVLDAAQNGGESTLSTPWPDVDRFIGGLAPGRLVVVGARPAVGKSLMGTNLALHFADHHNHAVLVASMEMNAKEVMDRMLAKKARVDLGRIDSGEITEAEWGNINRLYEDIKRLPISIYDDPMQTVASIRAVARDIARERDDLALIVVDYLQLLQTPTASSKASRAEALGTVSRGLKVLARETGACVVAMAQVNREGGKGGVRPTMGDLRESGAIEADANQVILLHRPDEKNPEIEVIVDKNRHGPKGIAHLTLRGFYAELGSVGHQNYRQIA